MIYSDNHVHTRFSTDSDTPMRSMIEKGISLGLSSICFTDHIDYGFPKEKYHMDFLFSMEEYFHTLEKLSLDFPNFSIRKGVELGLKKDVFSQALSLTQKYPFDFVIGSTHLVDDIDPYYPEYWDAYGEEEGIRHYYDTTYENITMGFDFDVYGHIDYVIRYCPTMKKARETGSINESFYGHVMNQNKECIDEILLALIDGQKGIELNTGGLKYGLGHPNPHESILRRYRTLGGTILTIGSDAHEEKHLAYDFHKVPAILKDCGFDHYTCFQKRKPYTIPLH